MFRLFFTGLCMGVADLVPGISGGTIAFIMGIYEPLLLSIKSVSFKSLAEGTLPWRFLASVLCGMACSMLLFSHSISYLLRDPHLRSFIYSGFLGLIVASVFLLVKQMKRWRLVDVASLLAGAIIAYLLSTFQLIAKPSLALSSLWLIFSGAAAIAAMLLPGISGSYVLMILGVYPLALESLADFSIHLKNGIIYWPAIKILSKISLGIAFGALTFSRAISWLLRNHHQVTLALLIGFMIGAMRTAWPFWEMTEALQPTLKPIMPSITSLLFWEASIVASLGFAGVLFIDSFARKKTISEGEDVLGDFQRKEAKAQRE